MQIIFTRGVGKAWKGKSVCNYGSVYVKKPVKMFLPGVISPTLIAGVSDVGKSLLNG